MNISFFLSADRIAREAGAAVRAVGHAALCRGAWAPAFAGERVAGRGVAQFLAALS